MTAKKTKLSATQKKVLTLIASGHVSCEQAGSEVLYAEYSREEVKANWKRNWKNGNAPEGLFEMERVPRGRQALRGLKKLGLVATTPSGAHWISDLKLTKRGREVLAEVAR